MYGVVLATASFFDWRSDLPTELYIDCPDGLAIVWWDSEAPWPLPEEHPSICAGLDKLHRSMTPDQLTPQKGDIE